LPSQEDGGRETSETPKPPERPVKPEDKPPNAESTEHTSGDNSQKTDSKLDRDMVFWTRAVGIFTALLVISSVLQYCAMRGQQAVMEGQLFGPNGEMSIRINYTIQNVGHSPAVNAVLRYVIDVVRFDSMTNSVSDQKRLCDLAQNIASQKAFAAQTIFPNDKIEAGGIAVGAILPHGKNYEIYGAIPNHFFLNITGCIDYTFGDDLAVHGQTGFTYEIYSLANGGYQDGFVPIPGMAYQIVLAQQGLRLNYFQ
jgi:hypothetical protein